MSSTRSGRREEPELVAAESDGSIDLHVDVGVLVAQSPEADPDQLRTFATRAAEDAVDELASATAVTWRFYLEGSERIR